MGRLALTVGVPLMLVAALFTAACGRESEQTIGDRPNVYNVVPGEASSEVLGAFGQPESKTTTVTGTHTMESWHYGTLSVIVDNGKVTSVSDVSR